MVKKKISQKELLVESPSEATELVVSDESVLPTVAEKPMLGAPESVAAANVSSQKADLGSSLPANPSDEPKVATPSQFAKNMVMRGAKFVIVPVLCVLLSYIWFPREGEWIVGNMYVRSCVLSVFIWNLIGAVLFAQERRAKARRMIALIFGVPLATTWFWAIILLSIIPTLMYWLPDSLK